MRIHILVSQAYSYRDFTIYHIMITSSSIIKA